MRGARIAGKTASLAGIMLILLAVNMISGGMELPYREKATRVRGLAGAVCIEYSRWGIPYIRAESLSDAFFALGYAMASDRLLQMDLLRRAASGCLSELLGAEYVEVDYLIQHMCFTEDENIPVELSQLFSAYSRGVNAYIESSTKASIGPLSRCRLKWSMKDSLGILGLALANPVAKAVMELTWSAIYARYGQYAMGLLPAGYSLDDAVLESEKPLTSAALALWRIEKKLEEIGLPSLSGFAVASPGFLWCSYMSGIEKAPAPYYFAVIEVGEITVYGLFIPGVPLPIAWSAGERAGALISLATDSVDVYIAIANRTHIFKGGRWYPLKLRLLRIRTPSGFVEKPTYEALGVRLAEVYGSYFSFKSTKVSWDLLYALLEAIIRGRVDTAVLNAPPVAIVLADSNCCSLAILGSYPDVNAPNAVKPLFDLEYAWKEAVSADKLKTMLQATGGIVAIYPILHQACKDEVAYYVNWSKRIAGDTCIDAIMGGYDPFAEALLETAETLAAIPERLTDPYTIYAFESVLLREVFSKLGDLYHPYVYFRQWALARLIHMLRHGDLWISEVVKAPPSDIIVKAVREAVTMRKQEATVCFRHIGSALGDPFAKVGEAAARGIHKWIFSGGACVIDIEENLRVRRGLAAAFAKLPNRVLGILYSGEGGHWLSPNYVDQLKLWIAGMYIQLNLPTKICRRVKLLPRG